MIKELKTLYGECRSNICIEHASAILEAEKAPENLSKKVSAISLSGGDKKVCLSFLLLFLLKLTTDLSFFIIQLCNKEED